MRKETDLGDDAGCLGAMTGVGGSGTSAGTDLEVGPRILRSISSTVRQSSRRFEGRGRPVFSRRPARMDRLISESMPSLLSQRLRRGRLHLVGDCGTYGV